MNQTDEKTGNLGGYIFVSHSHADLKKVRKIRNYLESREIEPILFYLHCMKDGNDKDQAELRRLINREIDARDWFLYLDSENARRSAWVQDEVKYAEQTKNGDIIRLNLDSAIGDLQKKFEKIGRAMRIYLTYSARDQYIASQLQQEFERQDFQVLTYEDAISRDQILQRIEYACRDGCFVPLLSGNSIRFGALVEEFRYAVGRYKHAFHFPIMISNQPMQPSSREQLERMRILQELLENRNVFQFRDLNDIPMIVRKIRKELIRSITE